MEVYNFTTANGSLLPPEFSSYNGQFEIQNGRATAVGSDPGGVKWVVMSESQADGVFEAEVFVANSGDSHGIIFRGTDENNFFLFNFSQGAQNLGIFRRQNGNFTQFNSTSMAIAVGQTYTMRVECLGGDIDCYFEDSLIFSLSQVSFNQTAKLTGARFNSAGGAIDSITFPSPDSISVITPEYRIWQRDDSDNATVTIDGLYSGNVASIERTTDNGATWVTAVASPANGIFSDSFSLSMGQYTVQYRLSNSPQVSASVDFISVGDVFLCYGQSNMVGQGLSNQTYSPSANGVRASLFGNDDNWKELSDPYDSAVNQVDAISQDGSLGGSWILRFANIWLSNSDVPVGFIPAANSGEAIAALSKNSSTRLNGLNLYESMSRRANAVGGIKAVLYEQGEADANNSRGTTGAVYQASLEQLANDINSDFGVETFVVPLHIISLANYNGDGQNTGQGAVRQAQIDAAASSANIRIAQPLTDIDLSDGDGLHFKTDSELDLVASRVYGSYMAPVSAPTVVSAVTPVGDRAAFLSSTFQYDLSGFFSGSLLPFTYMLSGALPDGLAFDSATGLISGVATAEGASSHTITVTDSEGNEASGNFTITTKTLLPSVNLGATGLIRPTLRETLRS